MFEEIRRMKHSIGEMSRRCLNGNTSANVDGDDAGAGVYTDNNNDRLHLRDAGRSRKA